MSNSFKHHYKEETLKLSSSSNFGKVEENAGEDEKEEVEEKHDVVNDNDDDEGDNH